MKYIGLVFILWNVGVINSQSNDDDRCRYRDRYIKINQYINEVDWGCYFYNRPDLFVGGILAINNNCSNILQKISIMKNDECIPFIHTNATLLPHVKDSFRNDQIYQKWLDCCDAAFSCCENHIKNTEEKEGECPPLWDTYSCFTEYTKAGEKQELVCSRFAYGNGIGPRCHHYSSKTCFEDGKWNQITDYSKCDITPRLIERTKWHIAMLSISLIVCAPSIFILLYYEQLRTQKHFLIRNLIFAIVIRNILVLMSKDIIILDELTNPDTVNTVMSQNGAACKVLTFFEKLSANVVFTCMLLEGIFLHQLLTNLTSTGKGVKMLYYYIAGIVISFTTAISWAILTALNNDINCWVVSDTNNYHWINDAPRLSMLCINTLLLIHLVWFMWKTFNNKAISEDNPAMRTAKASLICLPLFGLPFLFVVFRPDTDSCGWEQFYYFVSYALEGLQGVFVVIFYCYRDRDVVRTIKRNFLKLQNSIPILQKLTKKKKHDDANERRTTFSTFADTSHYQTGNRDSVQQPNNNNYFSATPKTEINQIEETNFNSEFEPPKIDVNNMNNPFRHKNDSNENVFINNGFETDEEGQFYNQIESIPASERPESPKLNPQVLFRNRADGIIFLENYDETEAASNKN